MTAYKWSTTAASNDTADSTINWREGQAPSTANDSARAMMAAIAKWRDDQSGNLVTAGTSTAYTLTTNQVYTALTDGISVTCRMDETSGAAPTLNVDSLGAKAIASVYGTAIATGVLKAGAVHTFVYDSTDDKWICHGISIRDIPTGSVMLFYSATAPVGWTVSDADSNKAIRIVSGASALGGAAGGTTAFTSVFTTRTDVAAHTHTFSATTSSNGAHTHTVSETVSSQPGAKTGTGAGSVWTDSDTLTTSSDGAHTHTVSGTTGSTGSGMDFAVQYISVIKAARD